MPAKINLLGQKIGRLTVLESVDNIKGRTAWKCQCDCGNIINVTTRRYNNVNLLVYPAAVQGVNTAETVIAGIETFNNMENKVDVIIIARGGGSVADLFGFNS